MPVTYKILGQQAPSLVLTPVVLYTVPNGQSAIISSITVANRGASTATFRVSVSQGGAATTTKDYIYYDVVIGGHDTFIATVGITLNSTDVMRVYASTSNITFQAFGSEIS